MGKPHIHEIKITVSITTTKGDWIEEFDNIEDATDFYNESMGQIEQY